MQAITEEIVAAARQALEALLMANNLGRLESTRCPGRAGPLYTKAIDRLQRALREYDDARGQ